MSSLIKNYCIDCKKEICKVSIRCKSCSQKGKNNSMFGKKRPDTSLRNRLNPLKGEKNPRFGIRFKMKEETKSKLSKRLKGRIHSLEHNLKVSLALKGKKRPSYLSLIFSQAMKNNWKQPNYVKKQMKSRGCFPNKKELYLDKILNILLPKQYKYVGNGEFIIAGKCPDFININGQKKIIELYGDYWHKGQNPQNRIDLFKQYGYNTLIVWEHELEDIDKLKQKIITFN